ncbi:MAG: ribosome biogenesis GTPase Der [Clostridia bacterium]
MKKPLVAIVGRPNVGKSSFFNKICGRRISIVEDTPGVTRDRIYGDAEWTGYKFSIVDTGGLDPKSSDEFQKNIRQQANIAIELADVIVFMVDGRESVLPLDYEVSKILRTSNKPIVLVVNKLDNNEEYNTYDFYKLGMGVPYGISCEQSKGLGDVLDEIVKHFEKQESEENYASKPKKIAIVGKPNAGKSSITNRILGEDRVVVSPTAGTTRDAIEIPFKFNGEEYIVVDTAGLRRQRGVEHGTVESYSVLRSMEAIERADIVLIVLDASEEISEQDVRIAGIVHESGKPSVVVVNKWDKVQKDTNTIETFENKLKDKLSFMSYFKTVYVSALTGKRFGEIMETAKMVYENSNRRITTSVLNDLLQECLLSSEPPVRHGRRLKIMYVTQTDIHPPTFVFFVNEAALMHFSYLRYLENKFRASINLVGTPIKIVVKNTSEK